MTRYHISLPPPVGDYDVEYVVNPDGVVWGIRGDELHSEYPARPGGPHKAIAEVAAEGQNGWRLATEEEIRAHCAKSGDWLPPELEAKAKRAAAKSEAAPPAPDAKNAPDAKTATT